MTLTVTGIGLIPADATGPGGFKMKIHPLTGCTATYDRSAGSLVELSNCEFSAPTGSFGGLVLQYDTTYAVVLDDAQAGIYSDPTAGTGLSTAAPAQGAQPIQVKDQNTSFGQVTTYFTAPLVIAADSIPQAYVVFDPTHWMIATLTGGTFSAPSMSGNPPIVATASAFGKAALYSNIGTTMSYRSDQCSKGTCESLLFLYGDAQTPVSVTWQDQDLCSPTGGAPVVAFDGNGDRWGTYGMLGLDAASQTLAWASPAAFSSDELLTGYTGVYTLPAASTVGQTSTLKYRCTTDVPTPASSGTTYSTGAPSFVPDGEISLTLLAN
jgi:hypothetical protein